MKMNYFIKKIAMLLVLVTLLVQLGENFLALSTQETDKHYKKLLNEIMLDQIFIMRNAVSELEQISINEVPIIEIETMRTVEGFDGEEYLVVECAPAGYMIYHEKTGNFLEYSIKSKSPYNGQDGDLIYMGPNEYYVKNDLGDNYIHTIDESIIDNAVINECIKKSKNISKTLYKNENENVLAYINGETDYLPSKMEDTTESGVATYLSSSSEWTYVDNHEFFLKLDECGYISGGKCGYIAAAILLTYDDVCNNYNTVQNSFYEYDADTDKYIINPYFSHCLYTKGVELGYDASTTSVAIHYTVKDWLKDRNVEVSHTSLYVPFANNGKIANFVDDSRPVIWFGATTSNTAQPDNNGNHAVVVYGYKMSGLQYCFVAHFGWEEATQVFFSGVLGSMYTYE